MLWFTIDSSLLLNEGFRFFFHFFVCIVDCIKLYKKIILKVLIIICAHLSMKIILLDPNLVRPFFGNKFFNPNYGAYLENNYFLVRTKLGYLRYSVFLNVPIKQVKEK